MVRSYVAKRRNTSRERMRPEQRHLALLITQHITHFRMHSAYAHAIKIFASSLSFIVFLHCRSISSQFNRGYIPHSDPCHASACLFNKKISFSSTLFISLFLSQSSFVPALARFSYIQKLHVFGCSVRVADLKWASLAGSSRRFGTYLPSTFYKSHIHTRQLHWGRRQLHSK